MQRAHAAGLESGPPAQVAGAEDTDEESVLMSALTTCAVQLALQQCFVCKLQLAVLHFYCTSPCITVFLTPVIAGEKLLMLWQDMPACT